MDLSKQTDNLYFILDQETETKFSDFKKGSTPDMGFVQCKGDKSSRSGTRVVYECEVVGEGIISGDYGHSVYCKLVDNDTMESFHTVEERAATLVPEGIEFTPFIKNDTFFLKLQQKDGKYKATIVPNCTPLNFEKSCIEYGSRLSISCTINMWINFKDKKSGLFLGINRVVVDGGKKKRK